MEAEEVTVSQEANAVAERLLGGDPGADSARVEQFFNQAAHVHGRGLGSIKQRPSQGTTLPASALAKSLKRGRTSQAAKDGEHPKLGGECAPGFKQEQQPSSDEDDDEERPDAARKPAHLCKTLTKQELIGVGQASRGSSKRKRKRAAQQLNVSAK